MGREAARGGVRAPVHPRLDGVERIETERQDPSVAVVMLVLCSYGVHVGLPATREIESF